MSKIIKKGIEYSVAKPDYATVYFTEGTNSIADNSYILVRAFSNHCKYVICYNNNAYELYEVYKDKTDGKVKARFEYQLNENNKMPVIISTLLADNVYTNYNHAWMFLYFYITKCCNDKTDIVPTLICGKSSSSMASGDVKIKIGGNQSSDQEIVFPGKLNNEYYGLSTVENEFGQYCPATATTYFGGGYGIIRTKTINFKGSLKSNNTNIHDNITSPTRDSVTRYIPNDGITIDLDRNAMIGNSAAEITFNFDFNYMELITILKEYTALYNSDPAQLTDPDVYNSYKDRIIELIVPTKIRHLIEIRTIPLISTTTVGGCSIYMNLKNNLIIKEFSYDNTTDTASYITGFCFSMNITHYGSANYIQSSINKIILTGGNDNILKSAEGYASTVKIVETPKTVWDGEDETQYYTADWQHVVVNDISIKYIVCKAYAYFGSKKSTNQFRVDLGEQNPLFSADVRTLEDNATGEVVDINDQAITGISMSEPFRAAEKTGCLHPISNYYTKYGNFYQGSVRFVYHIKNSNNTDFTGKIKLNIRTPKLYPDLAVAAVAATNHPEIETAIVYASNRDFKDDPENPDLVTSKGYSVIVKVDALPANKTINIAIVLNGTFAILPEE